MKSLSFLIILLFGLNCGAQNYGLDTTFGDNGIKRHRPITDFYPKNGLLINNNYYFISSNKIAKIDYNGNLVINFGTNGIVSITNTFKTYEISNFKFIDGYFYIYGTSKNATNNFQDIFISKIDENGNPDTTFGTNGMTNIDFGDNEILSDLIMEPNGRFLCLGTQILSNNVNVSKLIYFKLSSNGSIDTSFDNNGYKSYSVNLNSATVQRTEGKSIRLFNGKYLFCGIHRTLEGSTRSEKLLLTTMNNDGTIDTTYGNGGYRLIHLEGGMTNILYDVQYINNDLYANYFYSFSFSTMGARVLKYDLTTNQTIFNRSSLFQTYLQVEPDGFYTSGSERCDPPNCRRSYRLIKFLPDGNADTNFCANGNYNFRFPENLFGDDSSYMHIKEANGKILITGISQGGFSSIRIQEEALGNPEFESNTVSIYPNPFTNSLNISCDVAIKSLELFDLVGRKIEDSEFKVIDSNSYVVVPKISKTGMFVIKITSTDNKVLFKKVIKS